MKNKISVFGGTGFIGGRFIKMFPENTILINRNSYKPLSTNILYFISTINNYNMYDNLYIDIETNLITLMKFLSFIKEQSNRENYTINFVSSWFVYGQNYKVPFKEDSLCNPKGFYSITKRCAEQLLTCFCENFNVKYRIFRVANVIGEIDNKVSEKKNALQFFIKEILQHKDIHLYNGGNSVRDYMYVDDVCKAIEFCIKNANLNEIINIGSGNPYVFSDIINYAIKISNSKSKIISRLPTEFHNKVQVKDSYLDITKLKELGFKPDFTINQAINRIVDFYKKYYE